MPASKTPHPKKTVRERLLTQALKLYAAHGFAEVSLDEIATAARVTKPMIYHYFGNKADLYRTVAEECFALLRAGHAAASDEKRPALERLRAYVHAEFGVMRDNPDVARFIYRAAYSPPREAPSIDYW